ncbi:Stk1 family PASTA domain-containing Ser/Thr kinase [Patulibacter americanus]|uniref:Stk1 family PASTA domain-containing Ser/Thr kinase n=1 Tax=Patulibacter americanus TaxID=588672 RepID=UPI0003B69305|nr:Stk1 family PASTA domain-containing Ser/Thr kinase [Patulibacter americanus]
MNRAGQTIDGRYLVERRLGTGGMAEVYACEDLQLGRHVAVKVLHEQLAEDPDVVARFRRESQSAAGLQHPHIVQVFDRGDWDGIPYMAMELVDGVTLKDVIRDQAPLDPVKTIDQISQVLDALRYAHRRGLVHRDIKPQNVLVGPDGDLKVADFGIARAIDDLQMTQTGMIVGTAHYLSPEQASGLPVAPSADLYAVGVVLFEMLTGRMPFDGDQPVAIALKHVNEEPPALSIVNPNVPADLEYVVLKAMSKQPEDRFEDAEDFIAALQSVRHRIVSGAPVPAQPQLLTAAPAPGMYGGQTTGGWLQPAAGMAVPAGVAPEEARENAQARRRRRWTVGIVSLLAVLGVAAIAAYLTFGRMEVVPSVKGQSFTKAEQRLEARGFDVVRDNRDVTSRRYERGEVVYQSPVSGKKVRRGTTIRLVVSSGPEQASVPVVESLTPEQARAKLGDAGFDDFLVANENSDDVTRGLVTRTDPVAGASIPPGEKITIYVSQGPAADGTATQKVTVPDLEGQGRAEAAAALRRIGLSASFSEEESEEAPGTVIAQNPGARSQVDRGGTVAVTLAKEPVDEADPDTATDPTTTAPESTDVRVPNLTGRTRAAAEKALKAAGLKPSVVTTTTTEQSEDGKVVNQVPNGGRVAKGSQVTITVGKYQAQDEAEGGTQSGTSSEAADARTQSGATTDRAGGRTQSGTSTAAAGATSTVAGGGRS